MKYELLNFKYMSLKSLNQSKSLCLCFVGCRSNIRQYENE